MLSEAHLRLNDIHSLELPNYAARMQWHVCAGLNDVRKPVVWSETSVLGQDRSETKKSVLVLVLHALVLVLQILCYAVKHNLVTLVVIMILEDTAALRVLFLFSLFCAWNITTVEINSGVHLLKG